MIVPEAAESVWGGLAFGRAVGVAKVIGGEDDEDGAEVIVPGETWESRLLVKANKALIHSSHSSLVEKEISTDFLG